MGPTLVDTATTSRLNLSVPYTCSPSLPFPFAFRDPKTTRLCGTKGEESDYTLTSHRRQSSSRERHSSQQVAWMSRSLGVEKTKKQKTCFRFRTFPPIISVLGPLTSFWFDSVSTGWERESTKQSVYSITGILGTMAPLVHIFGRNRSKSKCFPSPTGCMLWSLGFLSLMWDRFHHGYL